jgi:hypothetical protein
MKINFIPFGIFKVLIEGLISICLRNKPKEIEYYQDGTPKKVIYR